MTEVKDYDIRALKNNVDRIDENIQVFKDEIDRMEAEKMSLFQIIAHLEAKEA